MLAGGKDLSEGSERSPRAGLRGLGRPRRVAGDTLPLRRVAMPVRRSREGPISAGENEEVVGEDGLTHCRDKVFPVLVEAAGQRYVSMSLRHPVVVFSVDPPLSLTG